MHISRAKRKLSSRHIRRNSQLSDINRGAFISRSRISILSFMVFDKTRISNSLFDIFFPLLIVYGCSHHKITDLNIFLVFLNLYIAEQYSLLYRRTARSGTLIFTSEFSTYSSTYSSEGHDRLTFVLLMFLNRNWETLYRKIYTRTVIQKAGH